MKYKLIRKSITEKNIKDKTSFMKKFKAELKKVIWPTPKQLFNNTVAVLSIVLITAIIVFVLDVAFESMNKYGVDKIKQDIVNSSTNNTENNETINENSDDSAVDNQQENSDTENQETETVEENNVTE